MGGVVFVVVASDMGPFHLLQADGQPIKNPSLVTPANRSAQCPGLTFSAAHLKTAECKVNKQVILV